MALKAREDAGKLGVCPVSVITDGQSYSISLHSRSSDSKRSTFQSLRPSVGERRTEEYGLGLTRIQSWDIL